LSRSPRCGDCAGNITATRDVGGGAFEGPDPAPEQGDRLVLLLDPRKQPEQAAGEGVDGLAAIGREAVDSLAGGGEVR
jgi:hypothetical protein